MKKQILSVSLLTALAIGAAAETPLWLRDVAISPDGSTVAFTYKGDIYTVASAGGHALQITSDRNYDASPVWRPDGRQIVFRSNREGSDDLYVVDAKGGTPRRLTTHSGSERPLAFLNDSVVLFSANIHPSMQAIQGPFQAQTYAINIDRPSARPSMWLSVPVMAADADASGRVIYQDRKGYEDPLRKHERSSGTADIWLMENGRFTKLTDFNGHSLNPLWKPGSTDTFYFVSEEDGTLNVYERSVDGKNKRQLTKFDRHPVRSLSASDNGMLAFSWNGEIYTMKPGSEPAKLNIEIVADNYDTDAVKYYTGSGVSRFTPSPDGEEVAFVIRGDVYVTNTKYKTTRRITNTPAQERNVSFSPDGRSLVYDSDRDGQWQLFTAKIKDPSQKQFAYATDIIEEPLYSCATSAQQPAFSPDGKKVAFLENRNELRVIDLDSRKVTTALEGRFNYSYSDGDIPFEWSPDSRWLLTSYIGIGGWNNKDIAIVAADGSEVIDLTESGYDDNSPQWALGGKAITYCSGKYGMKSHGSWGNQEDVFVMFLDTEAWDNFANSEEEAELYAKEKEADESKDDSSDDSSKKKGKKKKKDDKADKKDDSVKPLEFDLANRKYRVARLTPVSALIGSYYLDPKGLNFYYMAVAPNGDFNLMKRNIQKDETSVLISDLNGGFEPDAKGENLFAYNGSGGITKIAIPSGESKPVAFEAIYERKPSLEREYIYGHMWKQVKDKFYDANLHGVDWEGYGKDYARFLPHINNNRDFADLMSEILGELNASHTGARAYSGGASLPTASLGAFFDPAYEGDGLKVAEVLPRSPLASKKANVKPGDIITSINGRPIEAGKDYFSMLDGLAGRKTRLTVKRASGKEDEITVKPIGQGYERNLLYQRWVERNQAIVDSLSGGRIAYVHVQGMDSPSFRTVYDQLLGKYRNREAVIVDTRYNGGGWLHNDIALLLSGKEYVRFEPRGQYIGSEPFSQWTKPSVMLVNESNYSDAHGTPFVYQTLGIGDVVGAPVPGTMTAVWWETQIDPQLVFGIPQVTSKDLQGNVLENRQLNPDVLIYNNPGDVLNGSDAQLEGSVRHLLNKLDSAKSK